MISSSSPLFKSLQIGPMTVKNRFMRSATSEFMSENNGRPTRDLLNTIGDLIDGEVGLIIPGSMYTCESGKIANKQSGLDNKDVAEEWRGIIDYAHQNQAKIMFQLNHGGFLSQKFNETVSNSVKQQLPTEFSNSKDENKTSINSNVNAKTKANTNANDSINVKNNKKKTSILKNKNISSFSKYFNYLKDMPNSEIDEIISSFCSAASLAESVGADGVQLQAGHGFLLSLFLSPTFNRRKDKYKCNQKSNKNSNKSNMPSNNADEFDFTDYNEYSMNDEIASLHNQQSNILQEITNAIKQTTKPSFCVSIKINTIPFSGFSPKKNMSNTIKSLNGVDFFEISSGFLNPLQTCRVQPTEFSAKGVMQRVLNPWPFFEDYNANLAEYVKKQNPDSLIASVGGWRDPKRMEKYVKKGSIDLISISRPFLREPNFVKKIKEGKIDHLKCKSCGKCLFDNTKEKYGIHCFYP